MFDTICQVYRPEGTPLTDENGRLAIISVQIDRMSDEEVVQAKDAWSWHGDYGMKIITYHPYPQFQIQQEDVLIDLKNIDPDSPTTPKSGYRYVVKNRPKLYVSHQLLLTDTIPGR